MRYAVEFLEQLLAALFWPTGRFARIFQIALWLLLTGLGFSPEFRGAIDAMLAQFSITQVPDWYYYVIALALVALMLASRIAYYKTSPLRFLSLQAPTRGKLNKAESLYPNEPSANSNWLVFLPVQNFGYTELKCIARLYLVDSFGERINDERFPVVLLTKARFDRDDRSVEPFNLWREPKPLFICETTRNGGIDLVHQNGKTQLARGHYVFEICVESFPGVTKTEINIMPLEKGYYMSDGRHGYETALMRG